MGMFNRFGRGGGIDLADLQVVPGAPRLPSTAPVYAPGGAPPAGQAATASPGMFARFKPPTAAQVKAQGVGATKPSFWNVLDGVLGGETVSEAKARIRARGAAQQQQQQYVQDIEALNLPPEEKLLALHSPEEWMKRRAERYGFHDVAGGNTYGAGDDMRVAPRLVGDNGVYGVQTADGYTEQGRRGPSVAEEQTRGEQDFRRILDRDKFDWERQYQGGQLDVSRGQLEVGRMNANTSAFAARSADERGRATERRLAGEGGGGGGLAGVSNEELLAALRGGR